MSSDMERTPADQAENADQDTVLDVRELVIEFDDGDAPLRAVDGVTLQVRRGQRVAIVGESGSGKSTLALASLGLVPSPGRVVSGTIRTTGLDVERADPTALRRLRGGEVAMVFQDALGSLNPVMTIGAQLVETVKAHRGVGTAEATAISMEALQDVGIDSAAVRLTQYPHEFSGGMRQRVMIAMALACQPRLLVADEPTTALDVTTEASIMELLSAVAASRRMAVLLITHDLSLVSRFADVVVVLYAGAVVEVGTVEQVMEDPRHPYTRRLLGAVPRLESAPGHELPTIPGNLPDLRLRAAGCRFAARCPLSRSVCLTDSPALKPAVPPRGAMTHEAACHFTNEPDLVEAPKARRTTPDSLGRPLIEVSGLSKEYRARRGWLRRPEHKRVLDDVGFVIGKGEAFGLVGESGAGKSTVGRVLLGLTPPTAGAVMFEGRAVRLGGRRPRGLSPGDIQVVFQDPGDSLNPHLELSRIVSEPLRLRSVPTKQAARRVDEVLELVGLPSEYRRRRPGSLSGGQRQRVAIARALASNPKLLVCDEAVSSLDVSVRAQILNLLKEIQVETGIGYLFISHDLAVVRLVCDRMAVMRAGRIVEQGEVEQVVGSPQHEYTQLLLSTARGRRSGQ